ncbi:MAG: DNA polymerase III subunit gamma/tau [Bacteroidales bacterium OttesenSCG-928-I14]|jgi:DNA polymerase-3 subunit gamma/tau|nr:DNA polymerase III subunit gamma/tau [Bacteroidales bacterium OttesenSCG-928-I14]
MENYIVSSRKYRPITFKSVIGQKSLVTTLKNAIKKKKIAHAYLFCGPRGVGKTTCARIFAKTINCTCLKIDGEACNECESCKSFKENRSYNIYELDAASNNSVDNIRYLTDQVRIPPQIGIYKVYIIDEVHMLSTSAFNAFLKTLEEPPEHIVFILATTEKYKIIPTILSRCQIYNFNRITVNDIINNLEYIAKKENIYTEKEALNIIAQKAEGGMRDALTIFDQMINFSSSKITYKSIVENLNILDYKYYFQLSKSILTGNISYGLLILDEIIKNGFDVQQIIVGLADFFRDVMICKDPQTITLFETSATIKTQYLNLSKQFQNIFLYKAIELSNEYELNYRHSINKRLLIELLLIRLCQLYSQYPIEKNKEEIIKEQKHENFFKKKQVTINGNNSILKLENSNSSKINILQQQVLCENQQNDLEKELKQYIYEECGLSVKQSQEITVKFLKHNHVQIIVFNSEQLDELNLKKNVIKDFLYKKLQSNKIELDILIIEAKQIYDSINTNMDKFEFLTKKNPSLITFVKTFNLKY